MSRFMHRLVMCLLVLALPVQGFAASTMLLCGPAHHGASQASEGAHDHASHMHVGGQHAAGTPETSGHDHEAATTPAHDRSAFSPVAAKHAKVAGKCNVCAACCTAAFLPTTVLAFNTPAPSRALPVAERTTRIGFFTDGPDRPPRPSLA